MPELEEQLNAILSSPESMQQVAALAQMLSGQGREQEQDVGATAASEQGMGQTLPEGGLGGLSALLDGIDPGMISQLLPLLQELKRPQNDERAQLLYALKPFLKPERQNKVDSALRLARLLRVGKTFFKGFGDGHV